MSVSEIIVSAAELKNRVESLQGQNTQFNTKVQALVSLENSLNGMWDGDANDAFHSAFMGDKAQMEEFFKLINEYCTKLTEIATAYETAERTSTQIATERKYR